MLDYCKDASDRFALEHKDTILWRTMDVPLSKLLLVSEMQVSWGLEHRRAFQLLDLDLSHSMAELLASRGRR